MSVRSFRPMMSVATVAVAALGCYLVSLRVAAERAGLEDVETKIVLAQRDIRSLQTEIGTRGRLEQLERWNVKVLALSAPKADQFVDGGYQLARLARPSDEVDMTAPVVLAAAPRPAPAQPIADSDADIAASAPANDEPKAARGPAGLMHVASYSVGETRAAVPTPYSNGKLLRKSPVTVSVTTKPVKIAMIAKGSSLSAKPHDGKAAALRDPLAATPGSATSREKATH
ncbi:MAG: hypothetical protein ABIO85_05915 [Sphingomicrobium sp.]